MITLSARMRQVAPSATKAMTQMAADLRARGRDVVALSQGEPDFPTPAAVCEAAVRAIAEGRTTYTAVAGILPLRQAIAAKFARENGLDFTPDQVTVGCGAKQVLFNALMATLDPGDEVVFATPCWVSYPEMIKLAGGVPVPVATTAADGYRLRPEALRAALTPRTRWLMLNSPANPTGAVAGAEDLAALAAVLREAPQVMVLSDDIYEHLVYGETAFATMAAVAPDLAGRTLTVNGVSKSHAMTGWRVGYGAGPVELIRAMNTIQGQSTSHTCSIAQYAAIAALDGDPAVIEGFRSAFRRRRDLLCREIAAIPGLSFHLPQGAFYLFVDCTALIGRTTPVGRVIGTDGDLALYLLDEAGVALVPGSGFPAPGHLRISYAAADETLLRAARALAAAIARLS